ncbi:MAG: hypothetical protein R3E60_02625 [Alphaproteobacteria bacterium]
MLRLPVWHRIPIPRHCSLFAIALGTLLWLRWGIVTTTACVPQSARLD